MKIGIITMHHVDNLGSVLQSFALQHRLEQMGHNAQIIDYIPSPIKKKKFGLYECFLFLLNICLGFPKQKFKKKMHDFRRIYYKCSSKSYTRTSLNKEIPEYDIYCTGSDQVWNPTYIGNDTSYMLDFVPDDKPRISYAASFAVDKIPPQFKTKYADWLKKYQHITVREKSGVEIVKELIDKDSEIVCDPTLLLSVDEWTRVGKNSKIDIRGKYIIVYLLGYMFECRPRFYEIVQQVQVKLGYKVYFINGWLHDLTQPNSKVLFGVGPAEFIHLIQNASFVVTDSFHGTAFATLFKRPMLGVVKNANSGDGRLTTLLRKVNNEGAIVQYDKDFAFDENNLIKYQGDEKLLTSFRNESANILTKLIEENETFNNNSSL